MHQEIQGDAGGRRNRSVTILLVIICQSFQALTIGGVALFLPLIRTDLGLSFAQGGALSAATLLVYALMQIPGGYLTDRFGPKRLFFIGVLGTTVLSFTFGLVTEFWQALIIQILSGFFNAFLFTASLALLSGWFASNRRATALALCLIGSFLGNLVLDIVGPLLAISLSWRLPFLSFSAAGIIASFFLLRFAKESPTTVDRQKFAIAKVLQLFHYRVMWVCGIIQYVRLAVLQGIVFWLPSLLVNEKGLSLQLAGLLMAVQAGLICPSSILGGYISDRLRRPTLVIGVSLIILAITAGLLVTVNNLIVLIAVISINAIFVQMYFGPLFAAPIEILGMRTAGMSSGFSNFFANIGGLTFTYLLGVLKDASGSFESGFYAIGGVCIIGLVFTILLDRMQRRATVPTI